MSIEFSEVLTSFTKERYNKVALINLILCLLLSAIIIGVLNNIIAGFIFYTVIYIVISGYLALMSHNEAVSSKNVVPEINQIGEILKIGFKYLTGVSTLMILFALPVIICTAIMIGNIVNIIISKGAAPVDNALYTSLSLMGAIVIFGILAIILHFKFLIPAQLLFMQTLNLSDMFSYKKLLKYGKMIAKDYWIYILFFIIISMIINIAVQTVLTPIIGIYMSQNALNTVNPETAAASTDLFQIISQNAGINMEAVILCTIVQSILMLLFFPNLNGQIIRNALKRELNKNKNADRNQNYYDI